MAGEDGPIDAERVEERGHVGGQGRGIKPVVGPPALAVAAPRECQHAHPVGEPGSEVVEHVRGVPQPGEEHERGARSPVVDEVEFGAVCAYAAVPGTVGVEPRLEGRGTGNLERKERRYEQGGPSRVHRRAHDDCPRRTAAEPDVPSEGAMADRMSKIAASTSGLSAFMRMTNPWRWLR